MPKRTILWLTLAAAVVLACLPIGSTATPQKMDSFSIDRSRGILRDPYDLVKKHYYDPNIHGLNWDARYHDYDEKIKNAPSLGQAFGVVAGFLDGLKDSHVFFSPPARTNRVDYGYRMQLFGDNAFVTRIRPGSDAETKLHVGDQVIGFNRFDVNRADYKMLTYYFWTLAPQQGTQLVLRDPRRPTARGDCRFEDASNEKGSRSHRHGRGQRHLAAHSRVRKLRPHRSSALHRDG